MKNILNNKLLISIIVLFIFLIIIFSNNTIYASSYSDNEIIEKIVTHLVSVNEGGNLVTISDNDNGFYKVYCYDTYKIVPSFNEDNKLILTCSDFTRIGLRYYDEQGNFLYKDNSLTMTSGNIKFFDTKKDDYLYCPVDVLDYNGDVVNPCRPVLFQITEVAQIPETMNKVLQVTIPIGLVILPIGLIIYLIRLLVL